jgi:antitoxin (DNA-binding transcriptional repressor) of toxin-antitoxin stability system
MIMFMTYTMVMIKLNIHEVKRGFSRYLEMVEAGEIVVVCKRNVPVAELRRLEDRQVRVPQFGSARGTFTIPADFDEAPSPQEAALWEEGSDDDPLRGLRPPRR